LTRQHNWHFFGFDILPTYSVLFLFASYQPTAAAARPSSLRHWQMLLSANRITITGAFV
jgi:hypothetical protein